MNASALTRLRFLHWQGGGMYITGSSTQVTISNTNIYQNTASYVRACLLLETPFQRPPWEKLLDSHQVPARLSRHARLLLLLDAVRAYVLAFSNETPSQCWEKLLDT